MFYFGSVWLLSSCSPGLLAHPCNCLSSHTVFMSNLYTGKSIFILILPQTSYIKFNCLLHFILLSNSISVCSSSWLLRFSKTFDLITSTCSLTPSSALVIFSSIILLVDSFSKTLVHSCPGPQFIQFSNNYGIIVSILSSPHMCLFLMVPPTTSSYMLDCIQGNFALVQLIFISHLIYL